MAKDHYQRFQHTKVRVEDIGLFSVCVDYFVSIVNSTNAGFLANSSINIFIKESKVVAVNNMFFMIPVALSYWLSPFKVHLKFICDYRTCVMIMFKMVAATILYFEKLMPFLSGEEYIQDDVHRMLQVWYGIATNTTIVIITWLRSPRWRQNHEHWRWNRRS